MKASEMLKSLKISGLTEMCIAEKLGICQSSVNKIKRGIIKNPSYDTVRGIENLYRVIFLKNQNVALEIK